MKVSQRRWGGFGKVLEAKRPGDDQTKLLRPTNEKGFDHKVGFRE
jgi:hypothetical protein